MEAVFAINSYLLTGISMFFFNFLLFGICRTLCQAICGNTNLHIVYDKGKALTPRTSRISHLFGGPTGHLPLARVLSLLIALYAVSVILIDFSINGDTEIREVRKQYRSLIQAHPQHKPLIIDFENEQGWNSAANATFVSRRLVALAEVQACMSLNFSSHSMFSYAYEEKVLDRNLISKDDDVEGGECVVNPRFKESRLMFSWSFSDVKATNCNMSRATIETSFPADSVVGTGSISFNEPCNLDVSKMSCYSKTNTSICAGVGEMKNESGDFRMVIVPNASNPKASNIHKLPELQPWTEEEALKVAANVAFFAALDILPGNFDYILMAISEFKSNETLVVVDRVNISVVNLFLVIPVLAIVVFVFVTLFTVFLWTRYQYVYKKDRALFNTFLYVDDIIDMFHDTGLSRVRSKWQRTPCIVLKDGQPVIRTPDAGIV